MKYALAFLVLFSTAATAQQFGKKFQSLDLGMTKDEVIELLGNPDGAKKVGDAEVLQYVNRRVNRWTSWDYADYYVVFRDGVLSEYGTENVQNRDPARNALIFIPVQ